MTTQATAGQQPSQPVAVLSSDGLGPCPCCGSAAAFGAATGDDEGAYFVYCTTAQCGLTTNLMFACMDDPKPILAELWNRRTVGGKCVSALEADMLEAKGYIEELDRENDRLRAALRKANDQAEHRAQTPLTDADITALLPIWQQGSWTLPDYGRWVARAVERAHGIKTSHNLCLSCGHSIDAHDRQYGCAEDGCDCETPNAKVSGRRAGACPCDGSC